MKKIQQVSIKGILCRNNRILFLKTAKKGMYELPGGRMDFGESVKQTFEREIKEELGFEKIKMGNLINMWLFTNIRENTNYHFILFDFEFFTDESEIKLSSEHTEYKWIGVKELDEVEIREGHKESIKKYFDTRTLLN